MLQLRLVVRQLAKLRRPLTVLLAKLLLMTALLPLQVVVLLLLSVLLMPLTIWMLVTVLLLLLLVKRLLLLLLPLVRFDTEGALLPLPCPLLWLHAGFLQLLLRLLLLIPTQAGKGLRAGQLHDRLALLFPSRQRLSRGIHQHGSWHC